MSYILDALKKSAQERQRGDSPHLYAMHRSAPPRRNFTPFYLGRGPRLLMGGGLLLAIGLGIFLLIPRQGVAPTPPALQQTTSAEPATEPAGPMAAHQKAARQEAEEEGQPLGHQPSQKNVTAADTRQKAIPQVVIKENKVVLRAVPLKAKTAPVTDMVPKAGRASAVPQLRELPGEIRAAVPELKFAGHTYSEDPAQRMIIVNGQILREGDTIGPGTRLARITWDGVIVDFQDNQFLVKTN